MPRLCGHRTAAAGTAAAVALLLTGCGATGRGPVPSPQQASRQLRRALAEWAGFPVTASPRPLVLTGPEGTSSRITDPSGFPGGPAKLAYLERAIKAPANLPAGPASMAGYPLIGARKAWQVLKASGTHGPATAARLKVTRVRLGRAAFGTDRGIQRLPAWLFEFAGVTGPAAVLAVSRPGIYRPPGPPAGAPPVLDMARLGADGRTLTLIFYGAKAGTGPCTAGYTLKLAQSRTAVAATVAGQDHQGRGACPAVAHRNQLTTVLSAPLAARVLVDAASGTAVAVFGAAPAR